MRLYPRKKARRYGLVLAKSHKTRNFPPGLHGPKLQKRRATSYGLQLAEKQRAKIIYNISERQFRNYVAKAVNIKGNTGEHFLRLLEHRLDNVIYRLGLALSRPQARQLVNHGHVVVNGKKVNIPSYQTKIGETVTIRGKSQKSPYFTNRKESMKMEMIPDWLNWDIASQTGKIVKDPVTEDVKKAVNAKMIIEFYSR